jgi:hypothetical protein
MKRPVELFLVLWCLAALPAFGQQTNESNDRSACKFHFSVVLLDEDVPGGFALGMDKHQSSWYRNQAAQKYPGICYVADPRDPRVEYLLVYSAQEHITGPLPNVYINTEPAGGGFIGGAVRGYASTAAMLPEPKRAYLSVWHLATSDRGKRSLEPQVALYSTKHVSGRGLLTRGLSHPTRAVLEDGVRFLASLTR